VPESEADVLQIQGTWYGIDEERPAAMPAFGTPAAEKSISSTTSVWKRFAASHSRFEGKLRSAIRKALDEQRDYVLGHLRSAWDRAASITAVMPADKARATVKRSAIVDSIFPPRAKEAARLAKAMAPVLFDAASASSRQTAQEAKPRAWMKGKRDTLSVLPDPMVEEYVSTLALENATLIDDATMDELSSALSDIIASGGTYEDLVGAIADVYGRAIDFRSWRIARTEMTAAWNWASLETLNENGVVGTKRWISAVDERTREAHLQAAEEYDAGIPIGQAFVVDGEELDYPGDPKGSAGNVINCRCTMALEYSEGDAQ
jgi:hypothetical protein